MLHGVADNVPWEITYNSFVFPTSTIRHLRARNYKANNQHPSNECHLMASTKCLGKKSCWQLPINLANPAAEILIGRTLALGASSEHSCAQLIWRPQLQLPCMLVFCLQAFSCHLQLQWCSVWCRCTAPNAWRHSPHVVWHSGHRHTNERKKGNV